LQTMDASMETMFRSVLIAGFAATTYAMSIACLSLARSWQARLYNPGGWKIEFHSLRLSRPMVLVILLMMLVLPGILKEPDHAMTVFLVATVPLIVNGLALMHAIVAKRNLGGHWLALLYVSAFMLFPTVLMLLAIIALLDSVLDFRQLESAP